MRAILAAVALTVTACSSSGSSSNPPDFWPEDSTYPFEDWCKSAKAAYDNVDDLIEAMNSDDVTEYEAEVNEEIAREWWEAC